jgi:Asp-tRNA(Asn)/Glu-tRNA(Gln) amidotransferase A subunit family amidase
MKATSYIKAKQAQWELKQLMLQAISDVDVIVLPTMLAPSWRFSDIAEGSLNIGGKKVPVLEVAIGVTSWFNITGQPALAVPSGLSKQGVPLSIQFVAKPFCEAAALRAGALFESVSDWKYRRPPIVVESY